MGRKPIFEKPMTGAERQRRHRAKKRRANPEQSNTGRLETMLLQPGDLERMLTQPGDLEPWNPSGD
jgi:hypothetical protein